MLLFNKRMALAKLFELYCIDQNVKICPFSVITWLHTIGLLDEKAALEYLNLRKENIDDDKRSS